MTDKEKLEKIKQLADAMYNRMQNLTTDTSGIWKAMDDYRHFIIFQYSKEEPVSNPTPNEKMSVERWEEACKAACCDRNYRSHYGLTETRDDYFVDGVQWADEHPKGEPVSEDLEDAAVEAFKQIVDSDKNNFLEIFKAGAQWQKEQMMKDAIDTEASYTMSVPCITISLPLGVNIGDKVKVIIIKSE